jgi:Tol biopolymer transport system component
MGDLKSVLERGLRGFEPSDDAFERTLRRRDRKRRNQRIAAGVVGIAVFVAAIWIVTSGLSLDRTEKSVVPAGTGPVQTAVQPTPTPPAVTGPEPAYLIDLNTGEKTQLPKSIAGCCYVASPDGTMVAYVSLDDAGMSQFFIARVDGTDVQQVTQRGAWGPFDWSPDGAAIAYPSGWEEDVINIFVLDLATGETSQVTHQKPPTGTCGPTVGVPCGPQGAVFPQFSPDGASIVYKVYSGGDQDVRIVPVTGGKSVLLVDGATVGTLSPDGSTLAVGGCGRRFGGGLCIAHADGTNLRALVSGPQLFGPKWSPDGTRIAYNDQADGPTGNKVFVVDVATGETTFVADGFLDDWLDDHTLIIEPVPQ